jgi:hypothetical protein
MLRERKKRREERSMNLSVDVIGLSTEAVRIVESLVNSLRSKKDEQSPGVTRKAGQRYARCRPQAAGVAEEWFMIPDGRPARDYAVRPLRPIFVS